MAQPHHRNRHPKYQKKYKIHNWWSYEQSLINRGDLTLWLSEDVIESWNSDLGKQVNKEANKANKANKDKQRNSKIFDAKITLNLMHFQTF